MSLFSAPQGLHRPAVFRLPIRLRSEHRIGRAAGARLAQTSRWAASLASAASRDARAVAVLLLASLALLIAAVLASPPLP
ncbi:MAG: hypothetical protein ABI401_00540 [Candidatus Dormibacter sp.]